MRSIYHTREIEIHRMQHLMRSPHPTPIDVFISHDWPAGIWNYGDLSSLLRTKPYFRKDIENNEMGSPPLQQLLHELQPRFWFAGHMHVIFPAVVPHNNSSEVEESSTASKSTEQREYSDEISFKPPSRAGGVRVTRFLAVDKVIPSREYMKFLQLEVSPDTIMPYFDEELHFDAEWFAIMTKSHEELRKGQKNTNYTRYGIAPVTTEEIKIVEENLKSRYGVDLVVPPFSSSIADQCKVCGEGAADVVSRGYKGLEGNVQTDDLLSTLQLPHIWTIPVAMEALDTPKDNTQTVVDDPNAIEI